MTLTLVDHDHRYAVEQTLLMLLPGVSLAGEGPDAGTVTLDPGGRSARALFRLGGSVYSGEARAEELGLDTPADQKGLEQRLVKFAAYRALVRAVGKGPWGALSGVRPAKLAAKWLRAGATSPQAAELLTGLYGLERSRAALTIRCAQESLAAEKKLAPGDISLYIGVPFCPTRCAYCSFISADVAGNAKLVEPYARALAREIGWAGELTARRGLRVRSVYWGGGTPTTFSAQQLEALLTALDRWLPREDLLEFTVEAGRPDTITPEKLDVLAAHGVDRVSVNPQTLEPHVLRAMGRAHTPEQFLRAYELARGRFAVNTDLIAGLPQDSPAGFARTLDAILALAPDEVTVHTLALKHGSALLARPQDLPGEEQTAGMLAYAHTALPQVGHYRPYYLYRQKYMTGALENVGWTRREGGSFYNIIMMEELQSVLALGAGGVTKVVDRATGRIFRRANPKYPREYLERLEDTIHEWEDIQWPIN